MKHQTIFYLFQVLETYLFYLSIQIHLYYPRYIFTVHFVAQIDATVQAGQVHRILFSSCCTLNKYISYLPLKLIASPKFPREPDFLIKINSFFCNNFNRVTNLGFSYEIILRPRDQYINKRPEPFYKFVPHFTQPL